MLNEIGQSDNSALVVSGMRRKLMLASPGTGGVTSCVLEAIFDEAGFRSLCR